MLIEWTYSSVHTAKLLFSDQKHQMYPEADELIAIVYDASLGSTGWVDLTVEEDPEEGGEGEEEKDDEGEGGED
jgi:hypothetical protein